jgi:hypothetical protein
MGNSPRRLRLDKGEKPMKTTLMVVALLCFPVFGFTADKTVKGEVRDSSGKLLYKTYTRGNSTETRDASGKLVTKSKTTNGTTEVRSPTGKLLYKAK